MWAVTQSPFALMFAALGPVVAVASLADARIQQRRKLRRERVRFATDLALATDAVHAAHVRELAALDDATPAGPAIAARTGHDPARWKSSGADPLGVSLGRAAVPSALALEGAAEGDELAALTELASVLPGAPLVVDARAGIGLFGPGALPIAAARSIALQLAWALSPAEFWVSRAGVQADWGWLDSLPHPSGPVVRPRRGVAAVEFGAVGDERVLASVAVASARADLPGALRVVLSVGRSSEVVAHPDLSRRGPIVPEMVSGEHALAWAISARSSAESDGLVSATATLPGSVALGGLPQRDASRPGLPAVFCVSTDGPVDLDLVEHGPHAVVGGTTGSGKSELLTSWVLALATARSPEQVTFLLVDFKGGSAFGGLAALPHTVGLITDLDESEAERALDSLRAELKHRERELAAAGVKDVSDLAPGRLARLVVIVDEFAAMMADYPELHGLFSDVAARGRSLGVHLVLCTQRPAAVARDAVLANADLRVSLRVNNRADSVAVVGTDAAASIAPSARGRAVVSVAGEPGRVVQVAIASPSDVDRVTALWPGDWSPRRPWCPPLPAVLPFDGAFGLLDLPAEQRQEPARYDPVEHGHVLVLGAHRAGRSTALAALAASVGAAQAVPADIEGAWDAIAALRFSASAERRLLVFDDLDALLPRFSDEHRAAFVERLTRVLRDGPAAGIRVVISAQRVTGELQPIVALAPSRLLLRQASRQEHSLAGGEPGGFVPAAPPGRGEWLGRRVQVALGAPSPSVAVTAPPGTITGRRPLAVVASRPEDFAARLGAGWSVTSLDGTARDPRGVLVTNGATRSAIVGDAEEWQSHWGALAGLRATSDILFLGCSLADYRALTRSRDLPPPIAEPRTTGWLLTPDGAMSRATVPGAG